MSHARILLTLLLLLVFVQVSLAQTILRTVDSDAPATNDSTLSVGLVLHLPLNGSLDDQSGNSNDGTSVGGLTYTADRFGNPNSAAAFNGVDSYITVPDHPSLHPVDQVSICFWVRVDSIVANYSPLFSKAGPVLSGWRDREYYCELKQNFSAAYFELYSAGDGSWQQEVDSKTYAIQQWIHFAGIIDRKSHQMSIYINGNLDAAVSDPYSSFNQSTDPLLIGWTTEDIGYEDKAPLKGALTDFRIYNRALTEIEVLALSGRKVDMFPVSVDFGLVRVGTQDSIRVTVRNIFGPDPLMLGPMSSTNDAFSVQPGNAAVPSLESSFLTVLYSPSSVRQDSGSILIPTNHPEVPQLMVSVSGRGYELTNAPIIASIGLAPYSSVTARITWIRSLADTEGVADPVTTYSIWTLSDDGQANALVSEAPPWTSDQASSDPVWMFVRDIPAIGVERYGADVAFSYSYLPSAGVNYAVFMVVAQTRDLRVYRSEPDSLAFTGDPTGVEETQVAEIPERLALRQNYPNPFNPTTMISYDLPVTCNVQLSIFDMLGREVAILVDEQKAAGSHEVKFDGTGLASGVYLYRLTAGDFAQTRKMTMMR